MLGFGTFFASLRDNFRACDDLKHQPNMPAPTEPYERPEGIHEAAGGQAADGSRKLVALTFDDGPSGAVTNHILDSLQRVGGRATFFCIGERAQHYEETLRRMVAEGHEIASHSWSHERLTRLSSPALEADLARAAAALEEFSGVTPRYLRPPYGAVNERMLNHTGMPVILWSIDSEDWRFCEQLCKNRSDEQRQKDYRNVVNSVLDYVQDGDIILMHDLYAFTQDVADAIINELHHKGWQLVTVSELFEARNIDPWPGAVYYNAR